MGREFAEEMQQVLVIYRFHAVIVDAGQDCLLVNFVVSPTSQRDDSNVVSPGHCPNSSTGFIAVHARHAEIKQDDARLKLPGNLACFDPIMRHRDLMTGDRQQGTQSCGCVPIVVDHEHPAGRSRQPRPNSSTAVRSGWR
ncbi:MAG: hypothetical protein MUF06_14165 [Pirellulaceae bacterium]|nr:hypothetical protein [Pirellulaceae bacterium]